MPSVISGDANVSATEFGFLDGVTSGLQSQINSKLNLAGGKILQIVRATDSTQRSTTSATYVDVTGMSVTITPQKSDSAVMVVAAFLAYGFGTDPIVDYQVTDSSNNAISGTQQMQLSGSGFSNPVVPFTLFAYSTPATTSATTYKLRFRRTAGTTAIVLNDFSTGQMYAIEVSA